MRSFQRFLPILRSRPTSRKNYSTETRKRTPLFDVHSRLKAQMVPFCGWSMPLRYEDQGIIESHLHTRAHVSLFDVSHMGQLICSGPDREAFIETLTVADLKSLERGQATLSMITNNEGGIIDDTIVTNRGDHVYFVVNAGCFEKDLNHVRSLLQSFKDKGGKAEISVISDRALIAIQGPKSEEILSKFTNPSQLSSMKFMTGDFLNINGIPDVYVQRSGYTGEDGFEISIPASSATGIVESLLSSENVKMAGLGARDTLRLEAGLCLYGNDIDEGTTPKSAGLLWTISKRRRESGGFIGDKVILDEIKDVKDIVHKRVGLVVEGRPARHGAKVFDTNTEQEIGHVTSGTYGPSVKKNIAMSYIKTKYSKIGTKVKVNVGGKFYGGTVTKMPWITPGYKK
eukprot:TRINITY_DN808_c0_g1_i1.p1 TRINITY_DN808_c0_g1~~TRINITY_DN808_c0_g1_i1.p1  ORF type:complete len:400 (-),score=82.13 TRINITY_DN808_c0_g1_i1:52-1251(-)